MFPLIGVDSLLNSLEKIVIADNSCQNSSVNDFFFFAILCSIFYCFCFIIQSGLEEERKIFADKA